MRTCCLLLMGLMLLIHPAAANENRTWTDSTGRKVEATLVRVDGENVVLQSANGRQSTLPLTRLSDADQRYVKGLGGTSSTPGGNSSRQSPSSPVASVKTALPEPVRISLRLTPQPKLDEDMQWDCPPDPSPVGEMAGNVQPITFTFENIPLANPNHSGLYFSHNGKILAFGIDLLKSFGSRRDQEQDSTRFSKVWIGNLATGQTIETVFDEKLILTGIAPSGRKVAFRSGKWGEAFDNNARQHLYIGDVTGSGVVINKAFTPFSDFADPDGRHEDDDIQWANWVTDNHILISTRKLLILLNVDQGRPVWKQEIDFASTITLSPGRRYARNCSTNRVY